MNIKPQDYSIIVVEDESFLSKILAERLNDEGFKKIIVASNGVEALQKIKDDQPDLILLDMILPKMNGFEVLEELKNDDKLKNIPVLILSNLGQDNDIERAKELGADQYIVKSNFSMHKVMASVTEMLEKVAKS
ncbi:MAG: response regulator [bacterium]|nr:response regulator [bacterium]